MCPGGLKHGETWWDSSVWWSWWMLQLLWDLRPITTNTSRPRWRLQMWKGTACGSGHYSNMQVLRMSHLRPGKGMRWLSTSSPFVPWISPPNWSHFGSKMAGDVWAEAKDHPQGLTPFFLRHLWRHCGQCWLEDGTVIVTESKSLRKEAWCKP